MYGTRIFVYLYHVCVMLNIIFLGDSHSKNLSLNNLVNARTDMQTVYIVTRMVHYLYYGDFVLAERHKKIFAIFHKIICLLLHTLNL